MNSTYLLRIYITLLYLVIWTEIFPQQRINEELPKLVGSTSSVLNIKGWAKDDSGKWYEFNTAFNNINTRAQVQKIDLAKVNYEGKQYLCVAGFTKSFYIRAKTKHIQYSSFFWLLDTAKLHDLEDSDTTVHTRLYQNIMISSIIGRNQPVKWSDILVQIKRVFIGTEPNEFDTAYQQRAEAKKRYGIPHPVGIDISYDPYENFFIKYRLDRKNNKVQFYIGTLGYSYLSDEDFSFKDGFLFIDCYDKENNRNLNCRYFEIPTHSFMAVFSRLTK